MTNNGLINSTMNKPPLVEVTGVSKTFTTPQGPLKILSDISFAVQQGERVAIVGPSGSGKSTLLSLLGLLDIPSTGTITINEKNVQSLSEPARARFRNETIGFIFQSFELINPFTVRENVESPLEIAGQKPITADIDRLLADLNLTHRATALPETLSGGERQRTAIGRALAHRPSLILADEPTGSLDRQTGEKVLALLLDQIEQSTATLIIITHDQAVADRMDRIFTITGGTLHEQS